MTQRADPTYSPGAVAEALGTTIERARAALALLDPRDEQGRKKRWYTAADVESCRRVLAGEPVPVQTSAPGTVSSPPAVAEDAGTPEPVSAEDAAEVERELQQRHGRGRRKS